MQHKPRNRSRGSLNIERTHVARLVVQAVRSVAVELSHAKIEVELDVPSDLCFELDPQMVQQSLRNLLVYATRSLPYGGTITVTAYAGQQGLDIEVADSGPGPASTVRNRISGIGTNGPDASAPFVLAVVRQAAELHGGALTTRNCPEGGTAYTLELPCRQAKLAA